MRSDDNTVSVNVRFKNWKRTLEKDAGFKRDEASLEHKSNLVKWISFKQLQQSKSINVSVVSLVDEAHLALVKENRTYIGIIMDILLYTVSQGIAQCGHRENGTS